MKKPITERSSSTWNTSSSAVVARPAIDIIRNEVIDPAIHRAALRFDPAGAPCALCRKPRLLGTARHSTGPAGRCRNGCKKTVTSKAEPAGGSAGFAVHASAIPWRGLPPCDARGNSG